MNPDGFVFGPNAKLDLQGSLHISTATQLRLGETGLFETRHPERSLLVSAPPSAFGFLDNQTAGIEIRGSKLATREGQTLSILGGDFNMNGGRLRAVSGRINLAATAQTNELLITPNGLIVDTDAQLGLMTITNNASIDVGKQGAGDIYIRGGQFFLDHSSIIANTEIDQDSGLIAIHVDELHLDNQADIDSRAFGPGQGGQIVIKVAGTTSLSENSQIRTSSLSSSTQAGDAGNITIDTQSLDLFDSSISTKTLGPGKGGDITIKASHYLELRSSADLSTTIVASSESDSSTEAGNAGRIHISSRNFNLSGNSQIDNSTSGVGQGGSITVDIADSLRLSDQALISADSSGSGHAGSIYVNATTLEMDNATISTAAETSAGGNIIVNARSRLDMNKSLVSATVNGGIGNGGNLAISNPRFFNLTDSDVIANASGGHGGLILVITGTPIQSHNSSISATSETGLEGEVKIDNIFNVDIGTLPTDFLDATVLSKQRCGTGTDSQASRFFITGRGGLPNAPDDLQNYLPTPSVRGNRN
jgi:large exoprotein involved in heme utilization and adhesion